MNRLLMHRFIFIIMAFTMIAGVVRSQNREVYNLDESESIGLTYEFRDVVSQMLDTNEVFIQFRDVLTLNGTSKNLRSDNVYRSMYEYVAVVMDPCEQSTYVVYLFESDQLHEYDRKDVTNIGLYDLVWGNLFDVLEGKKSVYFSIAGELYNYPIEYLPYGEEKNPMNVEFNMYRVSDIEQLVFQRNDGYTNIDKAVVFGGLSFETGIKELSDSTTVLSFRDRFTFLSLYFNGVAKLGSVILK